MQESIRRLTEENRLLKGELKRMEGTLASEANSFAEKLLILEQRHFETSRDFRTLIEAIPALIGYIDKNLCLRFGNRAYAEWFGVDSTQLEGKHVREVIGKERYELNHPFMVAALQGTSQMFERSIPSPDGSLIRHSLAQYIPDIVEGDVQGFYVLVSDVSSIRNADYALREAQKLGGIGSFCLNLSTGNWTTSEVLDEIFGIDASYTRDVEGWVQLVHPEDRVDMLAYWQQARADKSSFDRDYRVARGHDGEVRWVHGLGNFVSDALGKPVQFIGSIQDITERKLKDERLLQKLAAIRLREQALSQITQGVIISGIDQRLTYVNEEFIQISGYSREEMLGQNCKCLQGPDSQPEVIQQMRDALAARLPFKGEIINYRKDGTPFWNELSINPVFDNDGQVTQFVGVIRDITRRKQAALELARAKEVAEAANAAKSAFLSTMSHELRTPMNAVLGAAQILQLPELTEAKRMTFADAVMDSGKALLALIDEILEYANIDSGEVVLQSVDLNPAISIYAVRALFSDEALAKSLQIKCEWHGSTMVYFGDSRYLKKMLSNLVSNAIQFTTQGSIKIEAREVECNELSGLLEFSVTDTGAGIAQDKLHLLFQPFSQVDSTTTRSHGGAGMGLSIVRKLAQLMGGEVGVESRLNQGSRFWFRVRLKRSH